MKKSKINLEDLLDKMDSVFKILNNIETLEDADINLLKKEANKIAKEIEEEYSDHLDSKE
jgi:hypothetical protein